MYINISKYKNISRSHVWVNPLNTWNVISNNNTIIYGMIYFTVFYYLRFAVETEKVSLHVTAELSQATLHQLDILILLQHQQRFSRFG